MEQAALVTGASSGIGQAVVRGLAAPAATVRRLLSLNPVVQVRDVVLERTLA